LIVGIILARLLTPEQFGLVGLTIIFTGFAGLFTDLGLGAGLVQRLDVTDRDLDFVFWSNLAVGATVTMVVMLCTPLIARFYHEPRLLTITPLLGLCPLLGSLGLVPGSLMQKAMRFKELAVIDMVTIIVSGSIGCACAFAGYGVMSLILQTLSAQVLSSVFRLAVVRWHPRFRLNWNEGRRLLPFGSGLLGANLVNYWLRNGDNLLVGKFCGAVQLGFYARAYSLMMLPLTQVHAILSPVLFPALSSMQNSKCELRRSFLFANQAIAVVAFPLMLGLSASADDFVRVLWGDHWIGSIPIIRVLALNAVGNSVGTTTGWVFMSVGRTDRMLWWMMGASPLLLCSFIIGVRWGGLGVAIAYTIASLVLWYPQWRFAGSLIDLSFRSAMINIMRPFACSLFMAGCVVMLRLTLDPTMAPAIRLPIVIAAGSVLYIAAIEMSDVPAYLYMRNRALTVFGGVRRLLLEQI
jgi:PST family polysaccharide transporter